MPKTVLLADDSVTIQKVVGITFANEDVDLYTVDNGDEALARARDLIPDIVLADVIMPGRSGYDVCQEMRSDPALQHIPVLLLCGTFESFDEARAREAGADGHLTKPFEAQTLVDRVNALLARAPERPRASRPHAPAKPVAQPAREELAPAGEEALDLFGDPLDEGTELAAREPGESFEFDASDAEADISTDFDVAADADRESVSEPPPQLRPGFDDPLADLGSASVAGESVLDPAVGRAYDVSPSELGESGEEIPLGTASRLAPGPSEAPARRQAPDLSPLVREQLHASLEKVAWEALGDVSERIVRDAVARIEAVAWEVIPQLAEALIREEIRRLKDEP